jgi:hypothetical protein
MFKVKLISMGKAVDTIKRRDGEHNIRTEDVMTKD